MTKLLLRIVVFLLIPCLIVDPALASMQQPRSAGITASVFQDQAIVPENVAEEVDPINTTSRVEFLGKVDQIAPHLPAAAAPSTHPLLPVVGERPDINMDHFVPLIFLMFAVAFKQSMDMPSDEAQAALDEAVRENLKVFLDQYHSSPNFSEELHAEGISQWHQFIVDAMQFNFRNSYFMAGNLVGAIIAVRNAANKPESTDMPSEMNPIFETAFRDAFMAGLRSSRDWFDLKLKNSIAASTPISAKEANFSSERLRTISDEDDIHGLSDGTEDKDAVHQFYVEGSMPAVPVVRSYIDMAAVARLAGRQGLYGHGVGHHTNTLASMFAEKPNTAQIRKSLLNVMLEKKIYSPRGALRWTMRFIAMLQMFVGTVILFPPIPLAWISGLILIGNGLFSEVWFSRYFGPFASDGIKENAFWNANRYGPDWVLVRRPTLGQSIRYYISGIPAKNHLAYVIPDHQRAWFQDQIIAAQGAGIINAIEAGAISRRIITYSEFSQHEGDIEAILGGRNFFGNISVESKDVRRAA